MKWLRWLPGLRELHQELERASFARILAEDRVSRADALIVSLREDLRLATQRADHAHQALANIFAQMHTGRKIFPDAPGLGVDHRPDPPGYVVDRPPTPMEARELAKQKFLEEGRRAYAERRSATAQS